MKAGWEARARARREKEREREEKEAEERRDEEERENNFEEWAGRLRSQHEVRCSLARARCTDSSGCVLNDIVGSDDQNEGAWKTKSSTCGPEECSSSSKNEEYRFVSS